MLPFLCSTGTCHGYTIGVSDCFLLPWLMGYSGIA